jgi:hypothetical protein
MSRFALLTLEIVHVFGRDTARVGVGARLVRDPAFTGVAVLASNIQKVITFLLVDLS